MMSRWFGRLPVRLLLATAALVGLTANSSHAAFITFESAGATSGVDHPNP